jgi:hypothetical protein
MPWPNSQDYNEAIQGPSLCFDDSELRLGSPTVNASGLPMPCSGNFADVYQLTDPGTGRKWALKCFTREVPGLRERYSAISAHLKEADLSFMIDFNYLDHGIKVGGNWYPILKMPWVEGVMLNEFVRAHVTNARALDLLSQIVRYIARRLEAAQIAHGDLQHGNILVVPAGSGISLTVKLIDYDGMFVPALARRKSGEVGHPAYQHPQRSREGSYCLSMDRFPALVIETALKALQAEGRALLERYDTGDNLLFRRKDLEAPEQSPLFAELHQSRDDEVRHLAAALAQAAREPLEPTTALEKTSEACALASPLPLGWYYTRAGQACGPVPREQLKQLALTGVIGPHDLLWPEGVDAQQAVPAFAALESVVLCNPAQAITGQESVTTRPPASHAAPLPDWLNDIRQLEQTVPQPKPVPNEAPEPLPKWLDDIRRLEGL